MPLWVHFFSTHSFVNKNKNINYFLRKQYVYNTVCMQFEHFRELLNLIHRTQFQMYEVTFKLNLLKFWATIVMRRQWHPAPVLLPGKSYGGRNLASYSPWGHKESDTTEQLKPPSSTYKIKVAQFNWGYFERLSYMETNKASIVLSKSRHIYKNYWFL